MALKGRSEEILIVTTVFLTISTTVFAMRCFVRFRLLKTCRADDIFMICATLMNDALATCTITGAVNGMGSKFAQLDAQEIQTALMWWFLWPLFYILTGICIRTSIALTILRIPWPRPYRIILWLIIFVTWSVGVPLWFTFLLQCRPVSYYWRRTGQGSCLNPTVAINFGYALSASAVLCDVTLSVLPVFLIQRLKLNRTTKIAVAGILAMGGLACVGVIIRLPYIHHYRDKEFLYNTTQITIWSNVEANLGVMAGNLITLRPLFRWFHDVSSRGSSGRDSSGKFLVASRDIPNHLQTRNSITGSTQWSPEAGSQEPHNFLSSAAPRGQVNPVSALGDMELCPV
ncbi:uncharacterized protein BDW43DRAFT_301675 [Aspergillus alliaceus]|uniref:uncharacterized protein n=1 Tax=Petromyces alliaceus TaxID=209559 RepID=UPI0012A4D664|nr:uncharacterized protein BDW43DRAFT_301675 [Aspergillus alliaceus]KAB8231457.1 hypothetical protein BDW43DRAFT_301675 [Aspergillus alliaceus]